MPYDIARTELVWPGKFAEDGTRREIGRVSLPFQVIERVNESRATREATKVRGFTLFDFQRVRRSSDINSAPFLAASIFLDILNVFLFFLQIFSGSQRD